MEKKKLRLGKMSKTEIAEWFGVKEKTYRDRTAKYQEKLESFCNFEAYRGGVNIIEIYKEEYDKSYNKKIEKILIKEIHKNKGLSSVSNIATKYNLSEYSIRQQRNRMFGDKPRNVDPKAKGELGYRKLLWAIKIYPNLNEYRRLTEEEDKIFDQLIEDAYKKTDAQIIKDRELILEWCIENGLNAETYQQILRDKDLDFFEKIIQTFKLITDKQLVKINEHEITKASWEYKK